MNKITNGLLPAIMAVGILSSGAANAALINVYNLAGNGGFLGPNIGNIEEARAVVDPANLIGSEEVTQINYPNGVFTSGNFPGAGFPIVNTFVLTASGTIDTNQYSDLRVGSDDGFELQLDGNPFSMFDGNRAFSFTTTPLPDNGVVSFELLYWENTVAQGLVVEGRESASSGWQLASVGAPGVPVSEPGVLALAGIGALGWGISRRRRKV